MLMQQFVKGLKSRSDETRNKAARELYLYVSTIELVLREISKLLLVGKLTPQSNDNQ